MLTSIITNKTPAGAAKLTLDGLLHWKTRLTGEVARLVSDIEAQEAMAERWCGKCAESLEELKALHTSKQSDLAKVDDAIAAIQHDLEVASAVATIHETAPLLLVPRQTGHPYTGCLIQSAKSPPWSSRVRDLAAVTPMSSTDARTVARQSSILVHSPDRVAKKLFTEAA